MNSQTSLPEAASPFPPDPGMKCCACCGAEIPQAVSLYPFCGRSEKEPPPPPAGSGGPAADGRSCCSVFFWAERAPRFPQAESCKNASVLARE